MIEIDNVSFSYTKEKNTLEDIDLTIPQGELILLCGESGCGKTTITKLINGLIPHFTAGEQLTVQFGLMELRFLIPKCMNLPKL